MRSSDPALEVGRKEKGKGAAGRGWVLMLFSGLDVPKFTGEITAGVDSDTCILGKSCLLGRK